jgi:hypothetical protein
MGRANIGDDDKSPMHLGTKPKNRKQGTSVHLKLKEVLQELSVNPVLQELSWLGRWYCQENGNSRAGGVNMARYTYVHGQLAVQCTCFKKRNGQGGKEVPPPPLLRTPQCVFRVSRTAPSKSSSD